MKIIAELIGYAATATVITLVIGLGYLWGSRRLDDEKMFRMVALLHDVDIDRIASETEADASEVPSEEPSPADIEWQRQVLARNYEVKMEALKRGKLNFDASFQGLIAAKNQFNEMAVKFEREIVEKGELSNRENLLNVVQNLELMKADQAKEELLNILKDDDSVEAEKRPSVSRPTESPSPLPIRAEVGVSISRIPGPPFGPS